MNNTNDYNDVDLSYPIIVTLQTSVNKYFPGSPLFEVPLFKKTGSAVSTTVKPTNIVNSNKDNIKSTKVQITKQMNMKLPKEYTRWFPTKTVPKGTQFVCVFINGDINKPYILGRYDR